MLVRIVAPHFVAGLIFEGVDQFSARCTDAAPILRYMRGWPLPKCLGYARGRGWQAQKITRS